MLSSDDEDLDFLRLAPTSVESPQAGLPQGELNALSLGITLDVDEDNGGV